MGGYKKAIQKLQKRWFVSKSHHKPTLIAKLWNNPQHDNERLSQRNLTNKNSNTLCFKCQFHSLGPSGWKKRAPSLWKATPSSPASNFKQLATANNPQETQLYLWPIINRTTIPFSRSNWNSFSPDQTSNHVLVEKQRKLMKMRHNNSVGNLNTSRHPRLSNRISTPSTTKRGVYPNHH